MAPHSSTLAWKIPWTEEPGGLHSMGSRRVGHDWAPSLSLFTFMHWRRKWQPTPVFLPGESQGRGAWWAAVYGVAQSQTRLKQLSSSHVLMSCRRLRHHPASAWKRPHSCSSGKFHFLKNATAIPLTLYALGEPCHSPIKRCPPLEGGRPCDCPGAESCGNTAV